MARAYEIIWSMTAANELEEICAFLGKRSIQGLTSFQEGFSAALERLAVLPESGSLYPSDTRGDVWETIVGNYRVFYQLSHRTKRIHLMHIWHSSRQDPEL